MKYQWRKEEKHFYLPKTKPEIIDIPAFNYFTIKGKGNPNGKMFEQCVGALYSVAYGVRMSYKWDVPPENYYEYTVYPLEGIWDIDNKELYVEGELINKDNLIYEILIKQPEFVTEELAKEVIKKAKIKKPNKLLDIIEFKTIEEGKCIQMLHLGSFDNEKDTFEIMDNYCNSNNLTRINMKHKEIYLSDPRKTEESKLKTVLRYKVK